MEDFIGFTEQDFIDFDLMDDLDLIYPIDLAVVGDWPIIERIELAEIGGDLRNLKRKAIS